MRTAFTILLFAPFLSFLACEIDQSKRKTAEADSLGARWTWPDSLDALTAAPANHALVFENEEYRILHVTVVPGVLDPIHTHKGKSLIWVTKTSPIVYNTYTLDKNNNLVLAKKDTLIIKPEELNRGVWENPEPPHSVENIGRDTFELYRIEYKNLP
jgi:hypothetical protein